MIIKFSNLGAIKETELDLRPLTVIIGPNNTNKTYIAYSIYGLWQSARSTLRRPISLDRKSENAATIKINKAFEGKFINGIEFLVKRFKVDLENFFQDSSKRLFSNVDFGISISHQEVIEAIEQLVSFKTLPSIEKNSLFDLLYENNVLNLMCNS